MLRDLILISLIMIRQVLSNTRLQKKVLKVGLYLWFLRYLIPSNYRTIMNGKRLMLVMSLLGERMMKMYLISLIMVLMNLMMFIIQVQIICNGWLEYRFILCLMRILWEMSLVLIIIHLEMESLRLRSKVMLLVR